MINYCTLITDHTIQMLHRHLVEKPWSYPLKHPSKAYHSPYLWPTFDSSIHSLVTPHPQMSAAIMLQPPKRFLPSWITLIPSTQCPSIITSAALLKNITVGIPCLLWFAFLDFHLCVCLHVVITKAKCPALKTATNSANSNLASLRILGFVHNPSTFQTTAANTVLPFKSLESLFLVK